MAENRVGFVSRHGTMTKNDHLGFAVSAVSAVFRFGQRASTWQQTVTERRREERGCNHLPYHTRPPHYAP